jgi:hypothetical protein
MNRSDSIANLAAALANAQAQFPAIPRNKEVKVVGTRGSYSFRYAPFEEILRATREVRAQNGIAFTQSASESSMATVIMHTSGEWIETSVPMMVAQAGMQGMGSALTYASRYGFCKAFGIQADDDDDANAADGNTIVEKPRNTATATMSDVYETLSTDEKVWIGELADAVMQMVTDGKVVDALADIDHAIPLNPRPNSRDGEYKLALQSRLDSKTLSALKRARQESLKKVA